MELNFNSVEMSREPRAEACSLDYAEAKLTFNSVETIYHFAGLVLAVTKVFRPLVSIGHKRIVYQLHIVTSYFTQRKLRNFL